MTTTVDPAAKPKARFVVMYDTPSDVDAFERHYNDVHIPLSGPAPVEPRPGPYRIATTPPDTSAA